jgi:hypothetical protein
VNLFVQCRSGTGGYACLPDAGGMNDQGAWLMDAFEIIEATFEKLRRQG